MLAYNVLTFIGSGRPTTIITVDVLRIVEHQMMIDEETTAIQLQNILCDYDHPLSLKTILKSRRAGRFRKVLIVSS